MKVYITSAYDDEAMVGLLAGFARQDRFGRHTCVEDPDRADIILFVEASPFAEASRYGDDPTFSRLRRHPLVRSSPDRCFMYNESDMPWCVLPGLYCSMPRPFFQPRRQRACGYLRSLNGHIEYRPDEWDPQHLYSFLGAPTAAVRRRIYQFDDPRGRVENTNRFNFFLGDPAALEGQARVYAEAMRRSQFVLCPRGVGTSSFRLFEAMQAGRCPVIISDAWVAPLGPPWDSFVIQVPEHRVGDIPHLLRQREAEARERGRRAREAFDEWFAADVKFHRMIEDCAALLAGRRIPEACRLRVPSAYYLWRSTYFRANRLKRAARTALSRMPARPGIAR